ncbi:uncharacterized protein V1518DRAFT_419168 [Limtongia smithiae]|uniref:uncharacterized protein n=1 Tax=Limtongia smithiae TaxID=1125753 RepID=UPI0034CD20FD
MPSSPSKRRKTTGSTPGTSPSKRRSGAPGTTTLDAFFSKKRTEANTAAVERTENGEKNVINAVDLEETTSADEEYARRLQASFDAEMNIGGPISAIVVAKEAVEEQTVVESPADLPPMNPAPLSTTVDANTAYDYIQTLDFSVAPVTFTPAVHASHISSPALYSLLARLFTQLSATRSRITILNALTNLFHLLLHTADDPSPLAPAVWLCTNALAPPYEAVELGIGGSILSRALRSVSGITAQALTKLYQQHGDIGDVAFEAKVSVRTLVEPPRLTIRGVHDTLLQISRVKGPKSQDVKLKLVEKLLIRARGEEVRFLTRTFVQNLRVGAVRTTTLVALARGFTLHQHNSSINTPSLSLTDSLLRADEIIRQVYARHPNYNNIVSALLTCADVTRLPETCPLSLHIPIMPMLGSITRDLPEMLARLSAHQDGSKAVQFACEFKYDGQRAQVHFDGTKVSIFSRHLESITDKYPDIVALFARSSAVTALLPGISSFIMEGEVVAIDRATLTLYPFQTLANRARKDVALEKISVAVCLFAFDLMYLNGVPLLGIPFRERRRLLYDCFLELPGHFAFARHADATIEDEDVISQIFKDAVSSKCEGIMVKLLDPAPLSTGTATNGNIKLLQPTYTPDIRHESWLKVKKDYSAAADSLDLVPIGAWHGNGRKVRFWSPVLLAVRDPVTGVYTAVCKCMTGFTDAIYTSMKEKYNEVTGENVVLARGSQGGDSTIPRDVESPLMPDVWFVPQEVWEIKFADITLSPVYTAARELISSSSDRGLSVRFPRFIRVRDDKALDDASTPEFLADLHKRQESKSGHYQEPPNDDGDNSATPANADDAYFHIF